MPPFIGFGSPPRKIPDLPLVVSCLQQCVCNINYIGLPFKDTTMSSESLQQWVARKQRKGNNTCGLHTEIQVVVGYRTDKCQNRP